MKTKPETVAPPPPAEDDPIAIAVRAYVQQVNKPEPSHESGVTMWTG